MSHYLLEYCLSERIKHNIDKPSVIVATNNVGWVFSFCPPSVLQLNKYYSLTKAVNLLVTFARGGVKIRLFIAINFNEEVIDKIFVFKVFKRCCEGKFYQKRKLSFDVSIHSETDNLAAVKGVMDRFQRIRLHYYSGLGKFKRREGTFIG